MPTLLQLATKAENEFRALTRSKDPLHGLKQLHDDLLTQSDKDQVFNLLEVATQKLVEKLSWELHNNKDMTPVTVGIPELLDLCIAGATDNILLNHAPYKILEDLMDGQTIVICEKLWELLETRRGRLTAANFIPPFDGKSAKTTKASLCLLRLSNTLLRRLSKTHNTVFCGRILAFLSFAFALSERSALNVTGRCNVSNVTVFEDEPTFLENTAVDDKSGDGQAEYSLYKTFWAIQRYFRQPNLASESDAEWATFTTELAAVLGAFESHSFNPRDVDRDTGTDVASKDDHGKSGFFQTKYLTNSRLFRLQLRDPVLRECMLTQFLILLRTLETAKLPATATVTQVTDMSARVLTLLKSTPSGGKHFSEMLTQVLDRENNWTQWKQDKCKPYERFPEDRAEPAVEAAAVEPPAKKVKQTPADPLLDSLVHEDTESLLSKIQGPNRKTAVPVDDFVQRFEEARDPENGIEREYWPDTDKMVCWRTMRGCMRKKITFMDKVIQGTGTMVEAILRVQRGDVIPASSPAPSNSDEPTAAATSPGEVAESTEEAVEEAANEATETPGEATEASSAEPATDSIDAQQDEEGAA